ncbi:TPA: dTMP kinase [Candidatus Dependentiae bacterium]|nr:MAG: Thymidylate kinase [candidate division TM6 bacterium GW2011_GWE2_31_21]KKP54084.1 MAG: Thymidylate kinase [candidate division TM6 bacterium GW2011_GWF2_33_332]HBS48334.1 dTMP kinase [Candidatus Dependentiae bacterium]HBZ72992.1 dTMP kinase [Candidatus Dependentiae bacterium]
MKKGLLITIEGIEGCGKSTLSNNLFKKLQESNSKLFLTKEPGQTIIGEKIKKILYEEKHQMAAKTEFLLFAANRAQHFHEIIVPKLNDNYIIISDRMGDSSIAYQGFGLGLDIETLQDINKWAMNDISPDLTIYVRLDIETAFKRLSSRGSLTSFEQQNNTFWQKTVKGFETIFKDKKNVLILDGTKSPEQLVMESVDKIQSLIK